MDPILYAMPVFLLTIVVEAWLGHRRGRPVYDIPDAITSLQHGVLSQLSGLLFKFTLLGIYIAVYEHDRLTSLDATNPWVWLGALLALDFCYYWSHRLYHEVAVLWASHVVHHSSEFYNLSTALRQPSTEWLFGWLFFLPLAVVGVPPEVFIGVGLIDLLYQYWVHTELIGSLGWFDRIFVSPSNHRVHHGQNDYCIDKNYGGILIIWDRLFNTFEPERASEAVVFGIRTPLHSYSPLKGVTHYYTDLWHASMAAQGWRARLGVWIAPPGGWDQPLPYFDATTYQRYSTPGNWYVVLHYLLTVPLLMHFIAMEAQLSASAMIAYAVFIVIQMQVLGAVLNGVRFARQMEQCRTLIVGLAFFILPDWFGWVAAPFWRWLLLALMLGSTAWLMLQRDAVKVRA